MESTDAAYYRQLLHLIKYLNILSEWTTWHYVYVFWLTFCANLALHNFKTLEIQESMIFGNTSYGITFLFTANGGEEHKLQI